MHSSASIASGVNTVLRNVTAILNFSHRVVGVITSGNIGPVGEMRTKLVMGDGWWWATQVSFRLTLDNPPERGMRLR